MNKEIKPLYRKVNTRARNVHHQFGSEARYDRHSKKGIGHSMKQGVQRGLDYTPLKKFLLSKVGKNWVDICKEAVPRLPKGEGMKLLEENINYRGLRFYWTGESTLYSGLKVDENNILQLVDPTLSNEMFFPTCDCCTFTFNGKVFVNKFHWETNTKNPAPYL